jgi:putative flavoprotein involved in K+ transport
MNGSILEVIIVGAGHAGLSASYYLKHLGLEHVVFEKGKIGESWRSQRWDSFTMNTANRLNVLPGFFYKGRKPDAYSSAVEFVKSLEDYVSSFQLPVSENTTVLSVDKLQSNPYFTVTVSQDNEGVRTYNCWQVIIASGSMNVPYTPPFAKHISPAIKQLHASRYRNSPQLPEGAVLVTGSAQTGCQLAEDLLDAGRKVYLSTSKVPRIPRRYRGKDIMDWLIEAKFIEGGTTSEIVSGSGCSFPEPLLTGAGEMGHTLSLQALVQKGAVLLGRMDKASSDNVFFENNVMDHIRFADEHSMVVKGKIDDYINRKQLMAEEAVTDEADMPYGNGIMPTISALSLTDHNITSIIWATGFSGKYDYIKLPVLDSDGRPIHEHGVSATEGLYFVDCSWQRNQKSNYVFGVKEDAGFVSSKVYAALR